MSTSHPADLANEVIRTLDRLAIPRPDDLVIKRLFQLMYHASILKEEAEHISFHMVFFNPANPTPYQPKQTESENWHFIPLEPAEEMNLPSIGKLAMASHPRSSALAVYPDQNNTLMILGLIDQLNRYEDFISLENGTAPLRPGLFEARIVSPGHILVTIGYEQIGELKIDLLSLSTIDIFNDGPLIRKLSPGINSLTKHLHSSLPAGAVSKPIESSTERLWIAALQRLLFRIKGLKHGGAVLISPDAQAANGLNIKYRLHYDRLSKALKQYARCRCEKENLLRKKYTTVAPQIQAASMACRQSEKTVEAAIWFMALLTRIDGLLLLNSDLDVIGFGAEITIQGEPASPKKALTCRAEQSAREPISYNYFGTRHRSMMRYCDAHPDDTGFVISQDGDVRAITRVDEDLCLWEDFRLLPEIDISDR